MSYSDYWDGDPIIVKYYREKYRHEMDRRNTEMWIQGAYIYDAILRCVPAMNFFSKQHKPVPYLDEPFPLNGKQEKEQVEKSQAKKIQATRERMMAWMETVNAKMMKGKEQTNA